MVEEPSTSPGHEEEPYIPATGDADVSMSADVSRAVSNRGAEGESGEEGEEHFVSAPTEEDRLRYSEVNHTHTLTLALCLFLFYTLTLALCHFLFLFLSLTHTPSLSLSLARSLALSLYPSPPLSPPLLTDGDALPIRAKREQLTGCIGLLPGNQGQNLAVTVSYAECARQRPQGMGRASRRGYHEVEIHHPFQMCHSVHYDPFSPPKSTGKVTKKM